jgi:hypothetical protein
MVEFYHVGHYRRGAERMLSRIDWAAGEKQSVDR